MLSLDSDKKAVKVSAQEKEFLNKYLAGAVKVMSGKPKDEAAELAETYVFHRAPLGYGKEAVEAKEAELKNEAKKFSSWQKLNYWSDADHKDEMFKNTMVGALGVVLAATMGASMTSDPNVFNAGMVAVGAAMAVTHGSMALVGGTHYSVRDHEKKTAQQYADIKHAQLVLKQVKRALESDEVKRLNAIVNNGKSVMTAAAAKRANQR